MPEEYARPIHRSNQVCHILEYVIVGASSYVTEASGLKMSGSAYLGPGVLIKHRKSFGPRFNLFEKTTVLKKAKNKFSITKCPIKPIPYHVYFDIVAFWRYI